MTTPICATILRDPRAAPAVLAAMTFDKVSGRMVTEG